MTTSNLIVRAVAGSVTRRAEAEGKNALTLLGEVIDTLVLEVSAGKTLTSTNEAGGGVTFGIDPKTSAQERLQIFQSTLEYMQGARRITRLRASFHRAAC